MHTHMQMYIYIYNVRQRLSIYPISLHQRRAAWYGIGLAEVFQRHSGHVIFRPPEAGEEFENCGHVVLVTR